MPVTVQLHIWPKELGCKVNERGNVEVVGMDRETNTIVIIEIHSGKWKHILNQFNRMTGVGILKANRIPEDVPPPPSKIKH